MENIQNEERANEEVQYETDDAPFTVGGVLGITWRTLFNNPVVFCGLALITIILGFLAMYVLSTTIPGLGKEALNFCNQLIGLILGQWIGGAIAYGVYQKHIGRRALLGASIFHGTRRLIQLIFIGILYGIGVFLGALLFIVPGIILMCMWDVAAPACVVERLGAADSLSRSAELTKGYRMKILGLNLIIIIFLYVANWICLALFITPSVGPIINLIILTVVILIPATFGNVMPSVAYFELRRVKEGVAVDSLANVFD